LDLYAELPSKSLRQEKSWDNTKTESNRTQEIQDMLKKNDGNSKFAPGINKNFGKHIIKNNDNDKRDEKHHLHLFDKIEDKKQQIKETITSWIKNAIDVKNKEADSSAGFNKLLEDSLTSKLPESIHSDLKESVENLIQTIQDSSPNANDKNREHSARYISLFNGEFISFI